MSSPEPPAGGFLLSPAPSSTTSTLPSTLPTPRSTPLRLGGHKSSALIRHLDTQILHIQRRFAKRSTFSPPPPPPPPREQQQRRRRPNATEKKMIETSTGVKKADTWGDVKGYTSMREASHDVEELVTIIWISGTPSLQIAYLISLASLLVTMMMGMPAPVSSGTGRKATTVFRVLGKLDLAFASLLVGRDVETGEVLPGFEAGSGRGVSGTEKVRIRGVVERTRVGVVEAFRGGEGEGEEEGGEDWVREVDSDRESDGELVLENGEEDEEDEDLNVQIARVYDLTMVELGDSLEEPSLGIVTGW